MIEHAKHCAKKTNSVENGADGVESGRETVKP